MFGLLCVLIALNLIFSPGTYTTHTIHTIEQQNQTQVDAIRNDPILFNQAKADYGDEASIVVVKDGGEN